MDQPSIESLFNLSEKAALVTGGAMGIGEAITRRLAEAGASVLISDIDENRAQETAASLQSQGYRVEAMQADSGNLDDIRKVTQGVVDRFGRFDILVNNAGIFPFSSMLETKIELWQKVIQVNLTGLFFHSQEAARMMVKRGEGGRIINIASIDAIRPTGDLVHYDASKGGVVMMTRSMALELGKHCINVNAIAPGGIQTPGVAAISTGPEKPPEQAEAIAQDFTANIPLGRMGIPDDIAKVALFLASQAADYITGETIVVDGGSLLA